jgi:uncharacterized protein (TIGR03083 family)
MTTDVVSSFMEAGDWFLEIAARDDVAERWSEKSALTDYTIGGLVGHVGAAIGWLDALLDTAPPEDGVPVMTDAGAYDALFPIREPADFDKPHHVYARNQGARAAERGPDETVARLRHRTDSLRRRLPAANLDRVLDFRPTLPHAIRLGDFIPTRTLELIIHGDDLAASLGLRLDPPEAPATVTLHTLLATARHLHGDLAVLRALARAERCDAPVIPVL